MKNKNRASRSLLDRAKSIFELINNEEELFAKSKLKEKGFSPATAENWLNLILFIQGQPKIRVRKISNNTYVECIENKFQQMSMKSFLDESLPIDIRVKSLEDYRKAQFTQERKLVDLSQKKTCKVCGKNKNVDPLRLICTSCIKKYTEYN